MKKKILNILLLPLIILPAIVCFCFPTSCVKQLSDSLLLSKIDFVCEDEDYGSKDSTIFPKINNVESDSQGEIKGWKFEYSIDECDEEISSKLDLVDNLLVFTYDSSVANKAEELGADYHYIIKCVATNAKSTITAKQDGYIYINDKENYTPDHYVGKVDGSDWLGRQHGEITHFSKINFDNDEIINGCVGYYNILGPDEFIEVSNGCYKLSASNENYEANDLIIPQKVIDSEGFLYLVHDICKFCFSDITYYPNNSSSPYYDNIVPFNTKITGKITFPNSSYAFVGKLDWFEWEGDAGKVPIMNFYLVQLFAWLPFYNGPLDTVIFYSNLGGVYQCSFYQNLVRRFEFREYSVAPVANDYKIPYDADENQYWNYVTTIPSTMFNDTVSYDNGGQSHEVYSDSPGWNSASALNWLANNQGLNTAGEDWAPAIV